MDHGLQHLRGGDDPLADDAALVDQVLLYGGQLLVGDLHAHVPAADHDALAGLADVLDVVDAGLVLDLGDQADALAAVGVQELPDVYKVLPAGHEGAGHVVHAVLDAEQQIGLVKLRQVDLVQDLAGEGHALAVGQLAAHRHAAADLAVYDLHHVQRQQAVGQQHAVAGFQVVGQALVVDGHAGLVAGHVVHAQREHLALLQRDLAVLEGLDAVFRALGVQHDGDGLIQALPHLLDVGDLLGVLLVGAVGEVDAGHVHARLHHRREGLGRLAGGADGADDLGLAHGDCLLCDDRGRSAVVGHVKLADGVGDGALRIHLLVLGELQLVLLAVA